jgi:hypothetical protein
MTGRARFKKKQNTLGKARRPRQEAFALVASLECQWAIPVGNLVGGVFSVHQVFHGIVQGQV